MREVYLFPPGAQPCCPNLHPLSPAMHFLPHGFVVCSAHLRGGTTCGARLWVWAHQGDMRIVVPVTADEQTMIAAREMNVIQVAMYLGLMPRLTDRGAQPERRP